MPLMPLQAAVVFAGRAINRDGKPVACMAAAGKGIFA